MDSAGPQGVHEVPHVQSSLDAVSGIQLTPGIESVSLLFHHRRRERNVTGDYEIAGVDLFDYFVVSDVKAGCHLEKLDMA